MEEIDDTHEQKESYQGDPPETAIHDRGNLLDQIYTNIPIVGSQVLEVPFSDQRALICGAWPCEVRGRFGSLKHPSD